MSTIQPISGFRQFTRNEAVAIMEAKTAKISEMFERELRMMQDKMHSNVRDIVKDQLELLSSRIEQNAKDIRQLMPIADAGVQLKSLKSLVDKNAENIKLLDRNIKSIDQNIRDVVAGT